MSFLNGNKFADRQAAAAKARKEMAEKFLANSKYDPADPAVIEREAKRKEILEARKVRDVERAKRKAEQEAAEAARRAAEEAARQEQLRLEALAREAEAAAPARGGGAARIRAQARARRALRRAQGAKEEEEVGCRTIRLSRQFVLDFQPRLGTSRSKSSSPRGGARRRCRTRFAWASPVSGWSGRVSFGFFNGARPAWPSG